MSRTASLQPALEPLRLAYDELRARGLKLDLTRGKPSPEQLDLASGLLAIDLSQDFHSADGTDTRNYGGPDGLPELRAIFGELLHIPVPQLLALGNASLALMHDVVIHALLHGVPGSSGPWRDEDVAFLCPAPGYDRHFAICEALGIRMIPVPFLDSGALDIAAITDLVADPSVRAMWAVPAYANPTGVVFDEATVKTLVSLPAAAPDFRLFWDNAYAVHHLTDIEMPVIDVLSLAAAAGNPDRPFVFASTSKITQSGAGVSFFGGSPANIAWYRLHASVQTIGPDKVNQLRHVRFLESAQGVRDIMEKHRALLEPKFAAVQSILADRLGDAATWTHPLGGYFITLSIADGTAQRAVQLAKEAGIVVTPAGAAFPYSHDPRDRVIRIAPSFPPLDDLKAAIDGLCTCALLAEAELSQGEVAPA